MQMQRVLQMNKFSFLVWILNIDPTHYAKVEVDLTHSPEKNLLAITLGRKQRSEQNHATSIKGPSTLPQNTREMISSAASKHDISY